MLVLALEDAVRDVEVDEVIAITLNPAGNSASRSVGKAKHLVYLVEEDVTASLKNIVGVLLLALEVQDGQVLISGPVDVVGAEHNPVGRNTSRSVRYGLDVETVASEFLLSLGGNRLEDGLLPELGLDLLLVGLECLVDCSVGGSQGGITLQHDAVTRSKRGDRCGTENKRGGIKLPELGQHTGVEDDLIVGGVLVGELTLLVGLVDLDEQRGLLGDSLLDLESGLGSENRGSDETDSSSGGEDSGCVLGQNQ